MMNNANGLGTHSWCKDRTFTQILAPWKIRVTSLQRNYSKWNMWHVNICLLFHDMKDLLKNRTALLNSNLRYSWEKIVIVWRTNYNQLNQFFWEGEGREAWFHDYFGLDFLNHLAHWLDHATPDPVDEMFFDVNTQDKFYLIFLHRWFSYLEILALTMKIINI